MSCIGAVSCETVVSRLPNHDDEKQSRVAIITGPTTGIGKYTAKILFQCGIHVILAGRSQQRLQAAADEIAEATGPVSQYGSTAPANPDKSRLQTMILDTSSLESVRKFVLEFLSLGLPLHLLINNAGIMMTPFGLSPDGFESQLATNHLGHFLLTELLLPKLKESAPSRIICVSSEAHRHGNIDLENLSFRADNYSGFAAYARSKLCNVLHARALAEKLKDTGVTAYSLHPGVVPTDLGRSSCAAACFYTTFRCCLHSISEGASTTVYCALQPGIEKHSGLYFKDTRPVRASKDGENLELAEKLYALSLQLVGPRRTPPEALDAASQAASSERQRLI
jgi:NAD(P)-dependent dehydrogenase (short-subunit alcohol dehydrogenase family)